MYLKTRYTLSLKFVPAQVRGNNHWSTSQVQLKILNYRTLYMQQGNLIPLSENIAGSGIFDQMFLAIVNSA